MHYALSVTAAMCALIELTFVLRVMRQYGSVEDFMSSCNLEEWIKLRFRIISALLLFHLAGIIARLP